MTLFALFPKKKMIQYDPRSFSWERGLTLIYCPRAGRIIWGTILDVKNSPPHPPRTTRGRAFRFALPLDPIPQRPREGDCGPPPLGFLPRPFSFGLSAFGPYFVTALGPPCPEGCYEVHPSGQKSEIGRPRVGFQRVGSADPALWSLKGGFQRGKDFETFPLWGFRGVSGGLPWPQSSPPENSPCPWAVKNDPPFLLGTGGF